MEKRRRGAVNCFFLSFFFTVYTTWLSPHPGNHVVEPNSLLFRPWEHTLSSTTKLSKSCRDFIYYTVLVEHSLLERDRHALTLGPNISKPYRGCAVLLLLSLLEPQIEGVNRNSDVSRYEDLGWYVVSATSKISATLGRRISRFPKLHASTFFPFTDRTLYVDTKYLKVTVSVEAFHLASTLLRDSQFGIIQHPRSGSLMEERDAIYIARKFRPSIVDSSENLELQVLRLNSSLSSLQQTSFGVEGKLLAQKLRGKSNSRLFDATWLQEFLMGSDRDQIAFYGAAARLELERIHRDPCSTFDRAGLYESRVDRSFHMQIFCDFESLVL